MKQAEKLCESQAFARLAEQHHGIALSIVAIEAGRGDRPDKAWVQCSKCGETFEFHSDGGWWLMGDRGASRFDSGLEGKALATV
jgi:hypothetical protein